MAKLAVNPPFAKRKSADQLQINKLKQRPSNATHALSYFITFSQDQDASKGAAQLQ